MLFELSWYVVSKEFGRMKCECAKEFKSNAEVNMFVQNLKARTNIEHVFAKIIGLQPHSDYGELFTLEEFDTAVKDGYFNEYDGVGHYATETMQSAKVYKWIFTHPIWATHVKWYNQ